MEAQKVLAKYNKIINDGLEMLKVPNMCLMCRIIQHIVLKIVANPSKNDIQHGYTYNGRIIVESGQYLAQILIGCFFEQSKFSSVMLYRKEMVIVMNIFCSKSQ